MSTSFSLPRILALFLHNIQDSRGEMVSERSTVPGTLVVEVVGGSLEVVVVGMVVVVVVVVDVLVDVVVVVVVVVLKSQASEVSAKTVAWNLNYTFFSFVAAKQLQDDSVNQR